MARLVEGEVFIPTVPPVIARALDVVTFGIDTVASAKAIIKANKTRDAEDFVVEFKQTPQGLSRADFDPKS